MSADEALRLGLIVVALILLFVAFAPVGDVIRASVLAWVTLP